MRAAAALAAYDSVSPGWQAICCDVALSLTRVKPEFLGDWKEALRPVRTELLGPLGAIFRDRELGELQQALATSTLADYAADDVHRLAELIVDADPRQFAELFPVLARHGEAAINALEAELDEVVTPDWPMPRPTRPGRTLPPMFGRDRGCRGNGRRTICSLPGPAISPAPRRNRAAPRLRLSTPANPTVPRRRLAARGGRLDSRLPRLAMARQADVEQLHARDADLREQGFVPIDVSVDPAADGALPRFTAVWERSAGANTEVRLLAGHLQSHELEPMAVLFDEKFNCQTAQVVVNDRGQLYGSSLWTRRKDQEKSTTRLFHCLAADLREDDCPGFLLTDALELVRNQGRRQV